MSQGIISITEARSKAEKMKQIADSVNELLDLITRTFDEVNKDDSTMYRGTKTAGQLRDELDGLSNTFNLIYGQVIKSADNIITMTNVKEEE